MIISFNSSNNSFSKIHFHAKKKIKKKHQVEQFPSVQMLNLKITNSGLGVVCQRGMCKINLLSCSDDSNLKLPIALY